MSFAVFKDNPIALRPERFRDPAIQLFGYNVSYESSYPYSVQFLIRQPNLVFCKIV
jgi:hypothetical protein